MSHTKYEFLMLFAHTGKQLNMLVLCRPNVQEMGNLFLKIIWLIENWTYLKGELENDKPKFN